MSVQNSFSPQVAWIDLTITNADEVRDFYAELLGLRPEPVDMRGYHDYSMFNPATGNPLLGICHKQGSNAMLPPQWIVYFTVPNLEKSITKSVALGADILDGPRSGFCVLRNPGGAVTALYQAQPAQDPA